MEFFTFKLNKTHHSAIEHKSSIVPQKEGGGAIIEVWELNIGKFVMYRWNSSSFKSIYVTYVALQGVSYY